MKRAMRSALGRRHAVVALAAAALVLSGCSTDNSSDKSASGLPDTIKIPAISETSGFAGPAGQATENGQKVAIKEINDTGFFGNSKLEVDFKDTGSQPAQGIAMVNEAIRSDASVMLGSILSTVAAAQAPLAERAKVPLMYFSSSSEFADGSQYVWAATPPAAGYFHWLAEYLADQKATKVGVIYNPDVESTQNWAETVWPAVAKDAGLEIVAQEGSPTSATDPSGVVTKVVQKNPDAVVVLASGTANNAIVLALKRAGFKGIIGGSIGMAGAINPLGDQAKGVLWPTNFNDLVKSDEIEKFNKLYQEQFNAAPNNYAAVAYDAVWFLAKAIKEAGTMDSKKINDALKSIGEKGFTGTLGDVTYKNNVSQAPGLLVEWDGKQEVPVPGYGS